MSTALKPEKKASALWRFQVLERTDHERVDVLAWLSETALLPRRTILNRRLFMKDDDLGHAEDGTRSGDLCILSAPC